MTYVDVRRSTWTYVDDTGRRSTYVDVRRRTWTYVDVRGRTSSYVDVRLRSSKYFDVGRRRSTDVDVGRGRSTYLVVRRRTWTYVDVLRRTGSTSTYGPSIITCIFLIVSKSFLLKSSLGLHYVYIRTCVRTCLDCSFFSCTSTSTSIIIAFISEHLLKK